MILLLAFHTFSPSLYRLRKQKMILGHKIRLKPYQEARTYFAQASGVARHAYNWGLAHWKERYEAGEKPTPFSLKKEYNSLKRIDFPWALEVTKCASEQAFADLGKAFGNFFRRVKQGAGAVGYPKFKKKGRCVEGFYLSNDQFKLGEIDGVPHIRIPKLGWVRMTEPLRFEGKIMGARVSKRGNHWAVSIQVDVEVDTEYWNGRDSVGIDLGIQSLMVCSDGVIAENQRVLTHHLDRLRRLNKKLSRQVKGSNNWWKTVNKLQRLHERVANIRKDYHHKWTSFIASSYGIIGIEDLAVSNMIKNRRLARHIADAGWRQIREQLEYKQHLFGSRLFVVDRWFASSKECHQCRQKKAALILADRTYQCHNCGITIDRDLNAAINIRNKAFKMAYG